MSGYVVRRTAAAVAVVVAVVLWVAPAASAATPFQDIASPGPLNNIYAGTDLSCQVGTSSDSSTEFFPGAADLGDCGTFLAINSDFLASRLFGPDFSNHGAGTDFNAPLDDYTAFAPVTQSFSGNGTSQNPYKVVTVVTASETSFTATLTQTDTYVVGQDFYSSTLNVQNGANSRSFIGQVFHAGDCLLRGLDTGFGAVESGSAACTLNANNSPASSLEQFVPQTPGNHYVENAFGPGTVQTNPPNGQIWGDVDSHRDLPDGCDCTTNEDNAMGINWDISLAAGGSTSFSWQTTVYAPGAPASVSTGPALPTSPTTATLNGSGSPNGNATTGHFIYGIDPTDRGPGFKGNAYDQSTGSVSMGSSFSSQSVSLPVSGLLPNTKYDVKFVASNGAGTTTGPEQTFTTPRASVPAIPPLGKENFTPHGTIFISLNGGKTFVKLTQTLTLPSNTLVDALNGSLSLTANSGFNGGGASDAKAKPKKPKTYTGTFSGAVFKVIQTRFGPNRGLTQIVLADQTPAFPGAPSYATSCKTHKAADGSPVASAARGYISFLRSRARGRWYSRGRYAAATVYGTQWSTIDRCTGTQVTAQVDTVQVTDLVRHIKILLHAHHSYTALAPKKKHK